MSIRWGAIPIWNTVPAVRAIEETLRGWDDVKNVSSFVGRGSHRFTLTFAPEAPNQSYGSLLVEVNGSDDLVPVMNRLKNHLAEKFVDSEPIVRRLAVGPSDPFKIEARLIGQDPQVLRQLARRVKDLMHADSDDVRDDWRHRKRD